MTTPDDYKAARALAFQRLAESDMASCCAKAGVLLQTLGPGEKRITIPYLTRTHHLVATADRITFDESEGPVKLPDQVVLLHYLTAASGAPIHDKWITFREVPSGPFYYPSFVRRAIQPLVQSFGNTPGRLKRIASVMGQSIGSPGDVALKIPALPRVPVVLSLWAGDDEFPPEGNVYFDESVPGYLPTEDIAYLAGSAVYTAIGLSRSLP